MVTQLYLRRTRFHPALNSLYLVSRNSLNIPSSFFLVSMIELLTINAYIISVFYQQILRSKLIKKRFGGPQLMALEFS